MRTCAASVHSGHPGCCGPCCTSLCLRCEEARITNKEEYIDRLRTLREPASTAVLIAMPSAKQFTISGEAFQFAMRCRLGLPCLMGDNPGEAACTMAASKLVKRRRHDGVVRVLQYACAISNRVVAREPKGRYKCHLNSNVPVSPDIAAMGANGVHDTGDCVFAATRSHAVQAARVKNYGYGSKVNLDTARANRSKVLVQAGSDLKGGRITAGEFNKIKNAQAGKVQDAFHPGYKQPCADAGDIFHPIVLTPFGGWWRWEDKEGEDSDTTDRFLASIRHAGDSRPDYDIEALRFDHDNMTWASWTHTQFVQQMVACATAVESYKGVMADVRGQMMAHKKTLSGDLWLHDAEAGAPDPEPLGVQISAAA